MTKKGLSLEQKRERVLEFFHETDGVFQLKEVEKEAVKRGVTAQSVKEVVQSLVDDNLVNQVRLSWRLTAQLCGTLGANAELVAQEKIGISNFLWAFAGKASTKLQNEEAALNTKLEAFQVHFDGHTLVSCCADCCSCSIHSDVDPRHTMQKQQAQAKDDVETERAKQDDPDVNLKLQAEVARLVEKKAAMQSEVADLEVVDPERYKSMKEAAVVARESANRWLDNLYSLKQWCNKKFPGREGEVDKFFEENGLTENVDFLE
jgi:Mnd1 HTH domain/Leucine zipper with capping helix domain